MVGGIYTGSMLLNFWLYYDRIEKYFSFDVKLVFELVFS